MKGYVFCDDKGTFRLKQPERTGYLYFPLAGEKGLKSAVTPLLGGDAKTDQNHFLLQPVSAEELHNNRSTRNFWCSVAKKGVWSATGASAAEAVRRMEGNGDESVLTAGFMWHCTERESEEFGLSSKVTAFVPVDGSVEILEVCIKNQSRESVTFTAYGAIPIYGRSADNIRDHRHVTSLLHRIWTTKNSVFVQPTLSFDERGHQRNETLYFVSGVTGEGRAPEAFYPTVNAFIGEGGGFDCPEAVYRGSVGVDSDFREEGYEAMGAMRFAEVTLQPEEEAVYILLAGLGEKADCERDGLAAYGSWELAEKALKETKAYWEQKVNVHYHTGNLGFDCFMRWVSFQPMLRRIYGCSFLPYHDYGKGGRGWRDLWQDCLALLLMNPEGVRELLFANFGGVRIDGTNATIIGSAPGEFIADRNNIVRVWMDHGLWPLITTALYIDQTGDLDFLLQESVYFKDRQIGRGTRTDGAFSEKEGLTQKDAVGREYQGSILEHLLLQNLTAFYEVGEHNHILLRGADWNDAMDMAKERGESVAFTAAYAGNLEMLAVLLESLEREKDVREVALAQEMENLLTDDVSLYESIEKKRQLLDSYCDSCSHVVSGRKVVISVARAADNLRGKAAWIREHIRRTEWIPDGGDGWFNSYYDNNGNAVEGIYGGSVRMMLTGQVFAIMSGTAKEEQIKGIINCADRYLYRKERGGYCLNTDFKELKMDLGRMFGFAYGHKENGGVFSHMAVMYANALYRRGFAREGYRVLQSLFEQTADFENSCIYPGIPEYFDVKGRGMYHYLTGAASWYMLTVITEVFGVKGRLGCLCLEPKLLPEQFDDSGRASLRLTFGGRKWHILYENTERKACGEYVFGAVFLDGQEITPQGSRILDACALKALNPAKEHEIVVKLI